MARIPSLSTYRSTDVTDDVVVLADVDVIRVPEGRVDLVPALLLHLLHRPLHLGLGDGVEAAESPLAIQGLEPGLVHVVQVVGADLLGAEDHWRHLMGLGPVGAGGVHADQLPRQSESLALAGRDHGRHVRLG